MFWPFAFLLLLKSVTSLFQSRLLDEQSVLLQLKAKTFPKENTQLNILLSDPTFPLHSFQAAVTRGRWNYSKYGFFVAKPFGASLQATFTQKSNSKPFKFLCAAIDDFLSTSFRNVSSTNCCCCFIEDNDGLNGIETQISDERIAIDVFYSFMYKSGFFNPQDAILLKKLMNQEGYFEADYISFEFSFTQDQGMSVLLSSLHRGRFADAWKDSPQLPFDSLNVECKHFLIPSSWMHGEYRLFFQNPNRNMQVCITGILPEQMHINFKKSILILNGEQISIFSSYCTFSLPSSLRPFQFKCQIPAHNSSFTLCLSYTVKMTHFSRYPFDANRGIDIGSPIVTIGDEGKRLILQNLLLSLPQPDFSMPYNVMIICFSISLIAFLSVRKVLIKDPFAEHPIAKKIRAIVAVFGQKSNSKNKIE